MNSDYTLDWLEKRCFVHVNFHPFLSFTYQTATIAATAAIVKVHEFQLHPCCYIRLIEKKICFFDQLDFPFPVVFEFHLRGGEVCQWEWGWGCYICNNGE